MKRRVYQCQRSGIDELRIVEEELPAPASHEVQIRIRALGLNFADIFAILGLYEAAPRRPFIPGLEYAGEVVAVGEGVVDYRPGERVMGVRFFGSYATGINVDARFVKRMPSDWSFEEGAAHIVASLTAYYGLVDQCRLRAGETVLIQSAAGGVGIAATRIAKKVGCFVIGVVGNERKRQICIDEGCDRVMIRSADFKKQLRDALGGRGLDVVMEAIGGETLSDSFDMLAPRGRITIYGFAQYMPHSIFSYAVALWKYLRRPRIDTLRLNNRLVSGFNLVYLFDHADDIKRYVDAIDVIGIGKPLLGQTCRFEELPQALTALKSGETVGKLVVTVA